MNTWKSGRKTIIIVCENCQKRFEKTQSEFNRSEKLERKHYCSLKCNNENKETEPKHCLNCSIEFIPNKRNGKFCSRSCNAKYNNKNRRGIKHNISKEGIIALRKSINNALGYDLSESSSKYYQLPNHCKECGKVLTYNKRKHVFCNIGCKRTYERKNMSEYQKYYKKCQFDFNLSDYPNNFDFSLIERYGWYQAKNHGNNLNGISRDHMISIKHGYENNISSEIIKHPANCQLIIHNENVRKHKNCSITLKELLDKINTWGSSSIG